MHVLRNESLSSRNTLALAGRATALVQINSDPDFSEALEWARAEGMCVVPLGAGSNVVIAGDLDALVMCIDTRGIEVLEEGEDAVTLRIAGGENWHSLVQWALQQGFYGLENLALIPGTVGAAPIQNIGAYGVELAPMVRQVHCVAVADGSRRAVAGSDCQFGYRDSIFKHSLQDQLVITAVELELSRLPQLQVAYPVLARTLQLKGIDHPTPQAVFDTVVDIRRSKLPDPANVPNAGSFFKNPVLSADTAQDLSSAFPSMPLYPQADSRVKVPAAWLIDRCGWKGYQRGGQGIHPEHALVLVNYSNDNGEALLSLAAEVAASVMDTFGIALEIEPRIYGAAV